MTDELPIEDFESTIFSRKWPGQGEVERPKNHHKKLDKKIDKNGTFILQHCPVNHIAAKGHTFFPWNLVRIRQRSHLFPVQSNIKTKGEKNRAKKVLAWAKRRDLQHRR